MWSIADSLEENDRVEILWRRAGTQTRASVDRIWKGRVVEPADPDEDGEERYAVLEVDDTPGDFWLFPQDGNHGTQEVTYVSIKVIDNCTPTRLSGHRLARLQDSAKKPAPQDTVSMTQCQKTKVAKTVDTATQITVPPPPTATTEDASPLQPPKSQPVTMNTHNPSEDEFFDAEDGTELDSLEVILDPARWHEFSFDEVKVLKARMRLKEVYERADDHKYEVGTHLNLLVRQMEVAGVNPKVTSSLPWITSMRQIIQRLELINLKRQGVSAQMITAYAAAQALGPKPQYLKETHEDAIQMMRVHAIQHQRSGREKSMPTGEGKRRRRRPSKDKKDKKAEEQPSN